MKNLISIFFLLLCSLMTACNFGSKKADDFYTATKDFDLWRVPLLKPYEVVSPSNDDSWFLILEKPDLSGPDFTLFGDEFQLSEIVQIGIQDSVIVAETKDLYWPALSGSYPSALIIDVKTGKSFIYSKEHHQKAIVSKYKTLKLENIQLYDWSKLKTEFQEKGKLPETWTH